MVRNTGKGPELPPFIARQRRARAEAWPQPSLLTEDWRPIIAAYTLALATLAWAYGG